ncbi:hypothetical protein SDC9_203486 [bioreactor metagenome]|uniref:Uncharacterized protein n=1 Tax=bioreactor metagenome TaxID=1076179 RepID=A0A645IY68_9ZZZZ|nr:MULTISPECIES: hypothetical protein [Comamonas]UUC91588.1 hypothetical protein NOX35_14835 [Comamonas sp. C11]
MGHLPLLGRLQFRQVGAVNGQGKIAKAKWHGLAGTVSTWPVFTEIIEDLGQAQNERKTCLLVSSLERSRAGTLLDAWSSS